MAQTIVALATGRPPSAIAVLRLSGPASLAALQRLTAGPLPEVRRLSLRPLTDPEAHTLLDQALVVWFAGPASPSGEDMAELHLHGGPAVIDGVLAALLRLPDMRLAEPGEFTRRAFANGRMTLDEVEGLGDLVSAETSAQRDQALALSGGALARLADAWRTRCLDVLAEAEAGLDFAEDEADVANRLDEKAAAALVAMAAELEAQIADHARAARIREGLTIVVSGAPNVGKSSLINALSNRDVAIVTALPGTTRDALEVQVNLDGLAATLIDTAGLRETDDPVEAEGIRRARARAAAADLVLHVSDNPDARWPEGGLPVLNKVDIHRATAPAGGFSISAQHGEGVAALRQHLGRWAFGVLRPGEPALLSHARHRQAFADAGAALRDAAEAPLPELRAEALRLAARAFGRIAGRVDVDDLLDVIFSRFCIGK
ncbi:tRNA uridine-5-carboxymethylaminomethyl(34) synthesis GTPase MnmE [Polymorphobacter sp.]|uniref:tRNA uridine-5-carboxymethylaminomethyl(34) synthesis GTPase MnmE n=1 Tax=Polymorphobacter sp. TaxID=1909290 RepID=UPI003F6E9B66